MAHEWVAELDVDAGLAAVLIEAQFPEFRSPRVEPLDAGWDNTVFRVDGQFVFRFPRRAIAVRMIETEIACLPHLGSRLPLPIPMPVFAGRPSDRYPWPFAGYVYLPGRTSLSGAENAELRADIAVKLGEFLKALHSIPPADLPAGALPSDELGRLDSRKRRATVEARLSLLVARGALASGQQILKILDECPDEIPTAPLVVAHGDLHAGQLLVSQAGRLTGVIDWGDLHLGFAAVDLAHVHQLVPASLHDRFLDTYGSVDALSWQLAKARAAWHAVALLASYLDLGRADRAREASLALSFILGAPC